MVVTQQRPGLIQVQIQNNKKASHGRRQEDLLGHSPHRYFFQGQQSVLHNIQALLLFLIVAGN